MIARLQQFDKKTPKPFSLFLCPPDVFGLIWWKNQILISLGNYAQLPVNIY